MGVKIVPSNITYYVNSEKGVVVARLSNLREENTTLIKKLTENYFQKPLSTRCMKLVQQFPDSYTGVAKLCSGDTFDEERGREIARNRLLKKVYDSKARIIDSVKKMADEENERISNKFMDCEEYYLARADCYEASNSVVLNIVED